MATQNRLRVLGLLCCFGLISGVDVVSRAENIYDALDELGCGKFKEMIRSAELESVFRAYTDMTVFVFNDTAYDLLPPSRIGSLYSQRNDNNERSNSVEEYVRSFTVAEALDIASFGRQPYQTLSNFNRKLFLLKKRLKIGNVASGTLGPTQYFANGARVIDSNIRRGRHVIHIIDQVLDMPLMFNAMAYIKGSNKKGTEYDFYKNIMRHMLEIPDEGELTYTKQIESVLQGQSKTQAQMTFFLPTNEAMKKIPPQKINDLLSDPNPDRLKNILALHIIPNDVVYTSTVDHNTLYRSQMNAGQLIFRKNFHKEAVYVTGSRSGGQGTVTARISPANITVLNGVVHHIDTILGYVFRTAIEEIAFDPSTTNFNKMIQSARLGLQNAIAEPNGVTVFVPTNEAMYAIAIGNENYERDGLLIDMVVERSILKNSKILELTKFNRDFESMLEVESMFNDRTIKIYSEGNDTWAVGGYVKARVTKPDIGVLNGIIHQIDAVFGVPTRDVRYTIFCEERLRSTWNILEQVGLDEYFRDAGLVSNQACSVRTPGGISGGGPVDNRPEARSVNSDGFRPQMCGGGTYRCQFTFFVPNGTAIDNFLRTPYGRRVQSEPRRMRWILRRLITTRGPDPKMYIDQMSSGAPYTYISDNGEEVVVQTDSRNSLPSSQRRAFIMFEGVRAEVIRYDLGATNGVIHIISSLLFTHDDLDRDVSASERNSTLSSDHNVSTTSDVPNTFVDDRTEVIILENPNRTGCLSTAPLLVVAPIIVAFIQWATAN